MTPIEIAWVTVKKYAWIFFACLAFAFAYMLYSKKNSSDLTDQILNIQRAHEEEIKKIREADSQLSKDKEDNFKKMQDTLAHLDEDKRAKYEQMDVEKKEKAAKLIEETAGDPRELAELLSKEFGLKLDSR